MADELPSDPAGVWHLIQRADEFVKYAQNRDPRRAFAQARDHLERALRAAESLDDRSAGANLAEQARVRMRDVERLEAELT